MGAWWASESGLSSCVPEFVSLEGGRPEALKTAHVRGAAGVAQRSHHEGKFPSQGVCSGRAPEICNTKQDVELFYPCSLILTKKRVLFCFLFPLGAVFSKTSIRGYIYY